MSYDNNADLTKYFTAVVEAEKLIDALPDPTTTDVLESVSKWGVQRCLDELSVQFAILRRTLHDIEIERQQKEKEQ